MNTKWSKRKWNGPLQYTNSADGDDLMMLPTDMVRFFSSLLCISFEVSFAFEAPLLSSLLCFRVSFASPRRLVFKKVNKRKREKRPFDLTPTSLSTHGVDLKNQKNSKISSQALIWDRKFRPHVHAYAKDEALFFEDFAKAFAKLLELGVPRAAPAAAASPRE